MVRIHIADKKGEYNTYSYDPKTGEMTAEEKSKWAAYVATLAKEQKEKFGLGGRTGSEPTGTLASLPARKPLVTDGVGILNPTGEIQTLPARTGGTRIKRVRK